MIAKTRAWIYFGYVATMMFCDVDIIPKGSYDGETPPPLGETFVLLT